MSESGKFFIVYLDSDFRKGEHIIRLMHQKLDLFHVPASHRYFTLSKSMIAAKVDLKPSALAYWSMVGGPNSRQPFTLENSEFERFNIHRSSTWI